MAPTPDTAAPDTEPEDGAPGWGRLLDTAGIIAAILLAAIVIDIATDGKLISRRLHKPPEGQVDERPAD